MLFVLTATPSLAVVVPADLTLWTAFDHPVAGAITPLPGSWVVSPGGTVAVQTVNGRPTFFASPDDINGNRFVATFTTPSADNDFFGIALGFTDPNDPAADYLLIDWRQGEQSIDWLDGTGPVTGLAGLAVSRVHGIPTLNELWGHIDSPANTAGGVTELERGSTLGSEGWADGGVYTFVVEYTTTSLEVWVNGSHELSLTGTFPSGSVALYDFSQQDLSISAIGTEPLNQAPELIGSGAPDVAVYEGQVGSTGGAFTDPNGDALTLSCSGQCAGFVDNGDGTWSWAGTLPEGPAGFSVTVNASDGTLEATDQFQVTVSNLAPVITATSGVPSQHDQGGDLWVSADFTDAGVLDTHTARFSWGDGTTSVAGVDQSPGSGSATAGHSYAAPGFYTVTVTVWDDDGDSDTATLGEVFVFDPDTFVTGGGWVDSPAGAWVDRPSHTGKATFGFIARYDRNGTVRGSVEFQVHKGMNFRSTRFEYLLINDGIAIFEGSGTLNGVAGHHFEVVATDERLAASSEDRFWMTITSSAEVVYDGSVYPAGGLSITGKGIQVHDKG